MTVETEIVTRLNAFSTLTDIVGSRIFASQAPQNVQTPCIVFHKLGSARESAFSTDTGDVRYLFQFDCYGTTYDLAVNTSEALIDSLQRYSGGNLHHVFVGNEKTMYNDEGELYRSMVEFVIWYKES